MDGMQQLSHKGNYNYYLDQSLYNLCRDQAMIDYVPHT